MCTVSFVRSGNKIIITSNRDEHVKRPSAAPKQYLINNKQILFPKDSGAGGTWFAADQEGNVIVLLNGAAEKHSRLPPYRKSRGLILLDIISADLPVEAWCDIDLNQIEPFTLIVFQQYKLHQMRWNGTEKETKPLDETQNFIWSSSTLYTKEVIEERLQWFNNYLAIKEHISETDMLHFHRYTEEGNTQNGLVINRNEMLRTLSITQTVIDQNQMEMIHCDLSSEDEFAVSFPIQNYRTH